MGRIDAGGYVALHVVVMTGWPLLLLMGEGSPLTAWVTFALNLALFVSVWRACSTPACGYGDGMGHIAGPMMSGCANITILYLPLVLAAVHGLATIFTILGMFPSAKPASHRFERLVRNFGSRSPTPQAQSILFDSNRPAARPVREVTRSTFVNPPLPPASDAVPPPSTSAPELPREPASEPEAEPEPAPPSRIPLLLAPGSRPKGKQVFFPHLPVPARDRLAAASRQSSRSQDLFSLPTEPVTGSPFGAAIGALALAGVFALAVSTGAWSMFGAGRSDFGMWWLLALPVFGFTALTVFQVARFRRAGRSRLRPAIVANPLLLARTGYDHEPVGIHYLCDLVEFESEHLHSNGTYHRTELAARFRTGRVDLVLRSRLDADRLAMFLQSSTKRLEAWEKEGDLDARLAQEDWLGLLPGSPSAAVIGAAPPVPWSASRANLALLSGALAVVLTGSAWGANLFSNEWSLWRTARRTDDPRDYKAYLLKAPFRGHTDEAKSLWDEAMWRKAVAEDQPHSYSNYRGGAPLKIHAEEANVRSDDALFRNAGSSIRALRSYAERLPPLPHASEAEPQIADLYRRALATYPPDAPGTDPDAVEAVRALLAFAVESGSPDVRLVFEPVEPLDSKALEEVIAGLTGMKNIQPMGKSFTERKNRARELAIATAIEGALRARAGITVAFGRLRSPWAALLVARGPIGPLRFSRLAPGLLARPRCVTVILARALRAVLPEGALELRQGNTDEGRPVLQVSCEVLPSGKFYVKEDPLDEILGRNRGSRTSSPAMKEIEERRDAFREVFVGVRFRFRLRAMVPDTGGGEGQDLGFSMEAVPAPNLTVEDRREVFGGNAEAVYDVMADSAFADFSRELARRFGAGGPEPGEEDR